MKVVVTSISLLVAMIVFAYAQGLSIVNKVGKEEVIHIVSGLTNGMPAREVQNHLANAGIKPDIGWGDPRTAVSAQGYVFTNSGTHTIRWKDKNGEVKSAEQPNTGGFVVQFTNGFLYSAYIGNFTSPTELGSNQSRIMIKLKDPLR